MYVCTIKNHNCRNIFFLNVVLFQKTTRSLDVLFIAQLALLFAELMHAVSFVNLSFVIHLTLCQFYNAVCWLHCSYLLAYLILRISFCCLLPSSWNCCNAIGCCLLTFALSAQPFSTISVACCMMFYCITYYRTDFCSWLNSSAFGACSFRCHWIL